MGYIKLSFNFTSVGDKRTNLEADMSTKQGNLASLSIPPEIKFEKKQLRVCLFRGKSIAATDDHLFTKKTCDPYLIVNYGEQTLRSET